MFAKIFSSCIRTYDTGINTLRNTTEWRKIRASRLKYQTECAQTLVCNASVITPEGGCGLNEIHAFQIFFARLGIVIIIYSFQRFGRGDKPIYDGTKFVLDTNNIIKHSLSITNYITNCITKH